MFSEMKYKIEKQSINLKQQSNSMYLLDYIRPLRICNLCNKNTVSI